MWEQTWNRECIGNSTCVNINRSLVTVESNALKVKLASMFVGVCLSVLTIGTVVGVYTTISSKANNVTFKYMKGVRIRNSIA